ncbi:PAS domain-containing protein [Lutimonas sp.]|uniref:PAS domain-containing protein n=1 Tax=Lutimonas sp. TaxID=1872403 RepID=UPI003D9BF46A
MNHDITKMMCLDVYLSSLNQQEYDKIKHLLKPSVTEKSPLMSWDVFGSYYQNTSDKLKREADIKELRKLALKLHWKNNLDEIFENESFEALVVTDMTRKIIWVNDGFADMTGYSKRFALHQTPKFLQGEATTVKQKNEIRQQLVLDEPFTKVITNYKKDNTPYECELKIFPLYGSETTHYLALEKQVS